MVEPRLVGLVVGLTARYRVWLLIVAIAAGAAGVWLMTPHAASSSASSGLGVWLALSAACALGDVFVVHINVGRHAHTLAFADVPVVVGLFSVTPSNLIAARLAGAFVAYGLVHRQRPQKLAFNVAQFGLGVCAALFVWQRAPVHGLGSQGAWAAAVVSLACIALVSSCAVTAVIRMDGGRFAPAAAFRTIGTSLVTAIAQASFALVALCVVRVSGRGVWAVIVVAGFLGLAQRAHIRLQKRHSALQRLNDVTAELNRELATTTVTHEIVVGAARILDGASAELELADELGTLVVRYDGSRVTTSRSLSTTDVALPAAGADADRLSVPLLVDGREVGTLSVTGSAAVRAFSDDDRQMLAALAQNASTALANGRLADELRVKAVENEHQANHDALTGLPNRVMFDRELSALVADVVPTAVLLLDLDRFKEVNDTLGHAAGDALLIDVGTRLQAAVPEARCIARLGGDEFAVLVVTSSQSDAEDAARAAQDVLLHPLQLHNIDVSVDASVGIAMFPLHGSTPEDLLRHADVAMYAAKEHRGAAVVYDAAIDHNDTARLGLVGDLRHAIANNDLQLHYQPKIDLRDDADHPCVEALCRWNHTQRGPISPDEFIAIAEQTGLINPLTDWVLDTALRQCRAWLDDDLDISISVNLSARVLRDSNFPERLALLLEQTRVPASRLTLEVTETAIMADVTHAIEVLWQLRRAGVRLSIDDLGVGQSSLAYLKRLPVDEVKIDKSFVMNMCDDPDDDAIVCAVVALAHRLRMSVVAEGVESQRIRDRLVEIECDTAQGYWYSRPMPVADVADWFRSRSWSAGVRSLRSAEGVA